MSEGPLYVYLLSFTIVRKKKTWTAAYEDIYNNSQVLLTSVMVRKIGPHMWTF